MKARIPKEYTGGANNMQGMIRQAQKMQEEMAAKQEELDAKEYEVQAGGGAVTVTINGKKEILNISISPEIVDPDDIETLSDVLTAAINEVIRKVDDTASAEMNKITGSMSLPNIPGMPGGLF